MKAVWGDASTELSAWRGNIISADEDERGSHPLSVIRITTRFNSWWDCAGEAIPCAMAAMIHDESIFPTSPTLTTVVLLVVGVAAISSMLFQVGPFHS